MVKIQPYWEGLEAILRFKNRFHKLMTLHFRIKGQPIQHQINFYKSIYIYIYIYMYKAFTYILMYIYIWYNVPINIDAKIHFIQALRHVFLIKFIRCNMLPTGIKSKTFGRKYKETLMTKFNILNSDIFKNVDYFKNDYFSSLFLSFLKTFFTCCKNIEKWNKNKVKM